MTEQREIKFRAWDMRHQKWVYYTLAQLINYEMRGIYDDKDLEYWSQYTGLKDKNGKEIYEGDIVKSKRGSRYAVEWWNNNATWGLRLISEKIHRCVYEFDGLGFFEMDIPSCEVIGNIYENPELLERE